MSNQLDIGKLLQYMRNVEPNEVIYQISNDEVLVTKFDGGQSNPTYCIKFGGNEIVLRKKPPGQLLKGAHQIEREYRVMTSLHSVNFPVPRTIHLCNDSRVIGTKFYLMELMKGVVINPSMAGIPPSQRRDCIFNCVKTLAQLHELNPMDLNLIKDYGRMSGYCKRVLSTWAKQYYASVDNSLPEMDALNHWLQTKINLVEDMSCIIHGDYSLQNIMYDVPQNKVLAVLDWELSTIGHPFMDFAYFCMLYHAPQEYRLIQESSGSHSEVFDDIPTEEEVMRYYCQLRNISFPISNWKFYLTLNFFKLASIVQGVYSRHLKGNASSTTAELMGHLVVPLIKTGLGLAKRADEEAAAMALTPQMILSPSAKGQLILQQVKTFLKELVEPHEKTFQAHLESEDTLSAAADMMKEWRNKAKAAKLWNLFLPALSGLSNVDYAHVAEVLGRSAAFSTVFNCNAPDTGNMEVLHMYGSKHQKDTWLKPLLDGEISSAFCMTEPQVASSDATNMELTIERDGDSYIVDGRKWWSTGAGSPTCKFGIVMGRTGGDSSPLHRRHSMIVVPFSTPGVTILRMLRVFGYHDLPHGHGEIVFDRVRVPARNLILGEGRGFEIAQGRLGPGRIHHCMRAIGLSERCVEMFVKRTSERRTFGKRLLEHQVVQHQLAECRLAIDQSRLLTLHAAHTIDQHGTKQARKQIAMIKVAVPRMMCDVIDKTIQVHGGAGVSQDFPLAHWYAFARTLRLADGPDEVHLGTVAKSEIRQQITKAKL